MSPARFVATVALVTCSLVPALADASPWTLPNDKFVLGLDYSLALANSEFLEDGRRQQFPLEGRFESSSFRLNGRYGFTERFEGSLSATFKQVTYSADPVVIAVPDDTDRRSVNDAILDFSQVNAGAGDLFLRGRYNFVREVVIVTTETELKVPTGYEQPAGTFAEGEPRTSASLEDDVTLGDGQTDLTQKMLFGAYIAPSRTFLRLDVGYSVRFGAPGHQAVGLFSAGQFLGKHVLLFASVDTAYTLFDGQDIGVSIQTDSPEKPAGELGPEDLIEQAITLDKDWVKVEGGGILTIRDIEVRLGYGQIVWGRNIPMIQSFSLGLTYAIPDLTGESAQASPDDA